MEHLNAYILFEDEEGAYMLDMGKAILISPKGVDVDSWRRRVSKCVSHYVRIEGRFGELKGSSLAAFYQVYRIDKIDPYKGENTYTLCYKHESE